MKNYDSTLITMTEFTKQVGYRARNMFSDYLPVIEIPANGNHEAKYEYSVLKSSSDSYLKNIVLPSMVSKIKDKKVTVENSLILDEEIKEYIDAKRNHEIATLINDNHSVDFEYKNLFIYHFNDYIFQEYGLIGLKQLASMVADFTGNSEKTIFARLKRTLLLYPVEVAAYNNKCLPVYDFYMLCMALESFQKESMNLANYSVLDKI